MNNRQLYIEKRKEVHTPEEFLAAFEDNTAIVFEVNKERRSLTIKQRLIAATCSSQYAISAERIMRKNKYKGLVQYENI